MDFRNLLKSTRLVLNYSMTTVFLNLDGDIDFLKIAIMGMWETMLF